MGTADVGIIDLFSPEKAGTELLTQFGFHDVVVSQKIPPNWPDAHRDADLFATGIWGKDDGDYPIPEQVTWIDDVTPSEKVLEPGRYWVTLGAYNQMLGADPHERAAFEDWLRAAEKNGELKILTFGESHGGASTGGEVLLYRFDLLVAEPWTWSSEHASLPTKGDPSEYEFDKPTPGQKEWIDSSKVAFEDTIKGLLWGAVAVGAGFLVLSTIMRGRGK
jgi:hypothetical protein